MYTEQKFTKKLPSYTDMLYSFKCINLKTYFTQEEIEELTRHELILITHMTYVGGVWYIYKMEIYRQVPSYGIKNIRTLLRQRGRQEKKHTA